MATTRNAAAANIRGADVAIAATSPVAVNEPKTTTPGTALLAALRLLPNALTIRYFFYLTNDHETAAADVIFLANDRCNQENLIDQLTHGVGATRMPVDTLASNGAYMVMAALAWTLKAWFALRLPETGRWATRYAAEKTAVLRMEFKTFVNAFMLIPVHVVRTSRRLVFRLLAWNPWQAVFLRGFDQLGPPLQC